MSSSLRSPAPVRGRISAALAVRPKTRLALLLTAPMLWLVVAYLGSLITMLVSAFWSVDEFTGNIVQEFTTKNIETVFTPGLTLQIAARTIGVAIVVTVLCALIAVPLGFYMSKVATPRVRTLLIVAVLTPLWASYLVKAYAWRTILAPDGPLSFLTGGHTPGYGLTATAITLTYLWLPYMVLPVYAGFEKVPSALFEASSDLGATPGRTIRSVLLPLVFPAITAGSIFTFSLTLGDYIAVSIVGGKTQLLANVIYGDLITANNQPLAAATALLPLLAIIIYLVALRRTGATENV
ncbi:ABC transporter permease [Nakamurella antarctica]|uniref:ABC transporter permease n=1 Tax=Nakamurella antarctica TaxID=1902245 RepID=A0A3G8ZQ04_9ACTN|nr:ABC transporter permease [Nakamurella antarctica]AZI58867.1 ABC transporter permease [Nakamurella antarctica]